MKKVIFFLALSTFLACNDNKTKTDNSTENIESTDSASLSPAENFAQSIEEAHNKSEFQSKEAVSFDIVLTMGGNERLNATITSLTNSKGIRIDKKDGSSIVFNGEDVFYTSEDIAEESAKFDIFSWHYFFGLPFKLTDPGTNWELFESEMVKGEKFNKGKLSFDKGIGDSPDDWYIIYQEPDSGLLYGAAYIVTFNKEREQAEEDPHAIVYHDYKLIEGIPIATKWAFHNWSKEKGFEDQIGEAVISNIRFIDPETDLFRQSENAQMVQK